MCVKTEEFQILIINANSETGFIKVLSNELRAKLPYEKVKTNSVFQENFS